MMRLETNRGTYDVNYILPRGEGLNISINSEEPLSRIAADLEGLAVIRTTESDNPNVTHTYEGYTQLTTIRRLSSGSVRVTLSREG